MRLCSKKREEMTTAHSYLDLALLKTMCVHHVGGDGSIHNNGLNGLVFRARAITTGLASSCKAWSCIVY
jgi:hypothetical protein